jgi:hypothetical protein
MCEDDRQDYNGDTKSKIMQVDETFIYEILFWLIIRYGNIQRMTDNGWSKQVPEWKEKRGRPRIRWMKGIQNGVAKGGVGGR